MLDRRERFRAHLREANLSQNQFARRWGLNPTTVRDFANRVSGPPPWAMRALDDYLELRKLRPQEQDEDHGQALHPHDDL